MSYTFDRAGAELSLRVASLRDAVLMVDRNLRLTFVCDGAAGSTCQTRPGLIGQDIFDAFPALKEPRIEEGLRCVLTHGKVVEVNLSPSGLDHQRFIGCRLLPVRFGADIGGVVVSTRFVAGERPEASTWCDFEELYYAVFANARDAICIIQDATIVLANQATCEMLGLPKEEVEGHGIHVFLSSEESERLVAQSLARQSGADLPTLFEFTAQRKDGTDLLVESVASRFTYQGRPAVLLVNRDVTWRKQAQNEIMRRSRYQEMLSLLSAQLWRHESLREVLEEMVWVLGESAEVSRCHICTFHRGPEGVVIEDAYEWCAVGIDSRKEGLAGIRVEESSWWWRCMCEGQVINRPEVDHLLRVIGAKSALTFPILVTDKPWGFIEYHQCDRYRGWEEDEVHALRVAATLLSSIVERKEGEAALRRSERFLNSIIEQSPISTLITNASGTAIRQNEACSQLLGIDGDERTLGVYSLFHDPVIRDSGYLPMVRQVFEEGKTAHFTLDYDSGRGGNAIVPGATHWKLDFTIFPIRDHTGRITNVVVQHRDTTEEDRLEQQLRQAQKMDAVGQLASGIAHDFNNLLTVIMGNLDLAALEASGKRPIQPLLENAVHAARRAADLTDRLLTFGRQTRMRPQPVSLNDIVLETVKLLRRTIDPLIVIESALAPESPVVEADPGQLTQVLMNLCLNARDAIEIKQKGEPSRKGVITIQTGYEEVVDAVPGDPSGRRPGVFAVLSVRDTGCGMDEATRTRIFEPFFTTKPVGKGTGLGLSTVYGIIRQHDGWIDCMSKPGQGTCFCVYLMRHSGEDVTTRSVHEGTRAIAGGNETILVVDDEELVRDLATDILHHHGYRLLVAPDGATAMDLFESRREEIALVLLDVSMPRMSGIETLEAILSLDPEAKVVLSSGYILDGLGFGEVPAGAKAFVHKPFRPDDLARTIREVLDS